MEQIYATQTMAHRARWSGGESLETCADLVDSEIEMKKINEMKYEITKKERARL